MQNAAAQPIPESTGADMERIFRQHARKVLAAAYRITGNAEDAEDVLQTVFMRLVRRTGGPRLADNPSAYLHRAAINAGLDLVRSRRSARATSLEDQKVDLEDVDGGGPEQALDSSEIRDQVRKAMAGLSPRSAEIFALRYFEGYENHEIAGMLGSSRSTIAVILHRARHTVREAIRPYVGETS